MYLSENIRFLRKQAGLTQSDFALKLGLKRPVIGAYEEGRAEPRLQTLRHIAQLFGHSIDQLIDSDLSTGHKAADVHGSSLRVLSVAVDSSTDRELTSLVPVKAAAGYTQGYGDIDFVGSLPVFKMPFKEIAQDRTFRVFQIEGESMLPIPSGSYIICEYVQDWIDIKPGKRYVLVTADEGIVFKRIQSVTKQGLFELRSDNPEFANYGVHANAVLEIWRAMGVINFQIDDMFESVEGVQLKLAEAIARLEGRVARMEGFEK
jgi:transcriptional regulator with XRE-family HTH domain